MLVNVIMDGMKAGTHNLRPLGLVIALLGGGACMLTKNIANSLVAGILARRAEGEKS